MADFNKIYSEIIEPNEGGWSNDPDDKGGETYRGIARNFHPNWEGWVIIDRYKTLKGGIQKEETVPGFALEELIKVFYRKHFWNKISGDYIVNHFIAANLFDFYINAPGRAIKAMQEALNDIGFNLRVDGKLGPLTLQAINIGPANRLNHAFNARRRKHYVKQAGIGNNMKFLRGWMNRVEKFENLV